MLSLIESMSMNDDNDRCIESDIFHLYGFPFRILFYPVGNPILSAGKTKHLSIYLLFLDAYKYDENNDDDKNITSFTIQFVFNHPTDANLSVCKCVSHTYQHNFFDVGPSEFNENHYDKLMSLIDVDDDNSFNITVSVRKGRTDNIRSWDIL